MSGRSLWRSVRYQPLKLTCQVLLDFFSDGAIGLGGYQRMASEVLIWKIIQCKLLGKRAVGQDEARVNSPGRAVVDRCRRAM